MCASVLRKGLAITPPRARPRRRAATRAALIPRLRLLVEFVEVLAEEGRGGHIPRGKRLNLRGHPLPSRLNGGGKHGRAKKAKNGNPPPDPGHQKSDVQNSCRPIPSLHYLIFETPRFEKVMTPAQPPPGRNNPKRRKAHVTNRPAPRPHWKVPRFRGHLFKTQCFENEVIYEPEIDP